MDEQWTVERDLRAAAQRLAARGLMKPGDTLALRAPALRQVASLSLSEGSGEPVWQGLDGDPGGIPGAVMTARADVGALLVGGPDWARRLCRLGGGMPGVFDEQIRHLGKQVVHLPAGAPLRPGRLLSSGANGFLHDGRLWCFGMTLDRLVQNVEILDKCAKAYVLAAMTGVRVRRIPWLVRHIANGRLLRDEKAAAAAHLRGERPLLKAGY